MRDCLEIIGDIIAIHLYKPGELLFDFPFNVQLVSVSNAQIKHNEHVITLASLMSKNGIAVDTYYNNIPEGSIIMERNASIKENSKLNSSGVCYSTKISIKTYDDIDVVRTFFNNYSECDYFDAIVVDSSYNVFIIRGTEPSTQISMSSSLPISHQHGLDIEIISVNGLLPISMGVL